jgi:DNA-binding beta-propeller fold protein YncE
VRPGRRFWGGLLMGIVALCWAAVLLAPAASAAGELSFVGCLQAPPAHACGGSRAAVALLTRVDDVAVSPDGSDAFALSMNHSSILRFARGRGGGMSFDGLLSFVGTSMALREPTAVAVSPDGRNVYATFAAPGAIVVLTRSAHVLGTAQCIAETGSGACGDSAPGLGGAFDVSISPDGRNVYVASTTSSAVAVFSRGAQGLLSFEECISDESLVGEDCSSSGGSVPGLLEAAGVAVDPSGNNVYVTGFDSNTLIAFSRDVQDGSLNDVGCIEKTGSTGCAASGPVPAAPDLGAASAATSPGLDHPERLAVSGDGRDLYVASETPGAVAAFGRNRVSGALTPIGCVGATTAAGCRKLAAGLSGAYGVAVGPDGRDVYATGFDSGAVVTLSRRASGSLSYGACVANSSVCRTRFPSLGGAAGLAISPDGKDVYVAAYRSNALVHLTTARPALSALRLNPSAFRGASHGPSVVPLASHSIGGTTVGYLDTAWGTTRFTVERAVAGIRQGKRCLLPHAGLRGHAHCALLRRVGAFTHADHSSRNSFRFTGWLAGSSLAPGNYALSATPSDAAGSGNATQVRFRVVS